MSPASKILSLIRFKAFDTSTVQGRSSERLRRVFWTASTSAMAKGINTLTMLAVIPVTLSYLGAERFGLWITITSAVVFLGVADLGLGNVIVNRVSEAYAKNDLEGAKKSISNAFFMLALASAGLGLSFAVIYPHVEWDRFFNLSSTIARQEAAPAVAVLVLCFILNLPLSIVPRVQNGYQEGYVTSIWQAVSYLIGLAGIVAVIHLKAGLPWFVLVIAGFPFAGNLLHAIGLFGFQRPWLIPRLRHMDARASTQILGGGLLFLVLQMSHAVIFFSDNVIIAKVLGPDAVSDYAVPLRLFTIVPMMLSMFLTPLWPAYAEANSRGDRPWMKKNLFLVVFATFSICVLSSLFLVVFGRTILHIWVGSGIVFSLSLMISLGMWAVLFSVLGAIGFFLNAINMILFQALFALLTAGLCTSAKVVLAGSVGLPGIALGNIVACAALMLLPFTLYLVVWFRKKPDTTRAATVLGPIRDLQAKSRVL